MNGLKIVFLDLDGVLNTLRWRQKMGKKAIADEYGYSFDVDITPSETNRDVIRNASPADIRWLTSKGYEIQMWLQKNKGIESYAILDDENFILSNQQDHFVQIDPIVGITNEDVMRVNLILQQC